MQLPVYILGEINMNTRQLPLGSFLCAVFIQQILLLMVAPSTLTTVSAATTSRNADDDGSLLIGAFNIQILGQAKFKKVEVVETLVKVNWGEKFPYGATTF